jgi:regulator of replication initiation timing
MATMSRTPNNATITVSPAKHPRAPRSKRAPVPTAKVRENQALRRTRRATRTESPPPFEFRDVEDSDDDYEEETENTATGLEELFQLVKDLKKTIEQQNQSIQEAQIELKELKEEQQQMKEQNNELKDEICTLRDHVDNLSALLPSTPSWASIAAKRTGSGSMQQTSNAITASTNNLARHLPSQLTITDTLYCTIDTSRVVEDDIDKASPGAIRAIVEKEVRASNGQSSWRCLAVTRNAKTTSRIKIACRDESEQHLIKLAVETKVAAGVRVLRDELYPIKVDNVNRLAVLDENGDIRAGAAEIFGQENETTVAKIGWLSKKNEPKAYGSMVVYLTKGSDASRLLREGFFHVAGESGYTGIFERRPRPEQCFNCQELGHKAFQCRNTQRCARCAGGGHRHDECTATILKCVPCGGPHESYSRNCRKLYPLQHE